MTIYAVGDIHGRLDLLRGRIEAISADAAALGVSRPRTVFLGDYIDRGPDSRGVLDLLGGQEVAKRLDAVFLLGNHDAMLLSALHGDMGGDEFHVWLARHGGAETLESFGIDLRRHGPERYMRDLCAAMPRQHLDFLGGLKPSWREPGLFFSHAGADPDKPLDEQTIDSLLYGSSGLFECDHDWLAPRLRERLGARLVHGHWRTNAVVVWPHRVGVDTGCGFVEGSLSAVALDGDRVRVLP